MIHTVESAISRLPHLQPDSTFTPADLAHLILAGGPSQKLYNVGRGYHQPAIEFLCQETALIGDYPIPGGLVREDAKGRPFFSGGAGSDFPANEHANEFLGILAVAGMHFSRTPILTDRKNEGTLEDMARAAMDTYSLAIGEPGWSLMAFSVYPGVTEDWTNERGELQGVAKILEYACRWPIGKGACLGTHVIEGISFAVSRFCLEQDIEPQELRGVWRTAFDRVSHVVGLMKRNQNDDGSVGLNWFMEGRIPRNIYESKQKALGFALKHFSSARSILYPTGHCLDSITSLYSLLPEDDDWMDRACYILAHTIETRWTDVARDVGGLAHAIHALKFVGH